MTVDVHVALLGVVVVLVTSRLLEAKPGIVGRDGKIQPCGFIDEWLTSLIPVSGTSRLMSCSGRNGTL